MQSSRTGPKRLSGAWVSCATRYRDVGCPGIRFWLPDNGLLPKNGEAAFVITRHESLLIQRKVAIHIFPE